MARTETAGEPPAVQPPSRRRYDARDKLPTMWNDRLRFAERVEKDWRNLNDEQRAVAAKALETIDEDPIIGAPLFEPLRGYWSYRSEGIRIIYRIVTEARFIVVLNIGLVMAR